VTARRPFRRDPVLLTLVTPGSRPWRAQVTVHLAHSRVAGVGLGNRNGYDPKGYGVQAGIENPDDDSFKVCRLTLHQPPIARGVRITLLKVWDEPGAANDAADLRIDRATAS
jgi:hypothetical protein